MDHPTTEDILYVDRTWGSLLPEPQESELTSGANDSTNENSSTYDNKWDDSDFAAPKSSKDWEEGEDYKAPPMKRSTDDNVLEDAITKDRCF